jgi:hypothetical protein
LVGSMVFGGSDNAPNEDVGLLPPHEGTPLEHLLGGAQQRVGVGAALRAWPALPFEADPKCTRIAASIDGSRLGGFCARR